MRLARYDRAFFWAWIAPFLFAQKRVCRIFSDTTLSGRPTRLTAACLFRKTRPVNRIHSMPATKRVEQRNKADKPAFHTVSSEFPNIVRSPT
jgi:hypothetical protein